MGQAKSRLMGIEMGGPRVGSWDRPRVNGHRDGWAKSRLMSIEMGGQE